MTMMTALSLLSPWALHPARLHHRGGQVACSHWSLLKTPHEWQHGMHTSAESLCCDSDFSVRAVLMLDNVQLHHR